MKNLEEQHAFKVQDWLVSLGYLSLVEDEGEKGYRVFVFKNDSETAQYEVVVDGNWYRIKYDGAYLPIKVGFAALDENFASFLKGLLDG